MITRQFGLKLSAYLCAGTALAVLAGIPAEAQFGQIFGAPPRPPANVPNRPPAPPPFGLPEQMPPEEMDDDVPQTPTARATPPQFAPRPQPGAVRSQPLAPPPGAAIAPSGPPPSQAAVPPPGQRAPASGSAPPGNQAPASTAPQPGDEIVTEMPSQKIANPTAVFAGLDKITGRIISFEVPLNEKIQFGALQVTPRVCYTRPPTESANTDSFVEVNEITLQGEVKRIFTGWMFASSPGLHAVEHPIYDVWLTDCKGGTTVITDAQPPAANSSQQHQPPAPAPRSGTASSDAPARNPAPARPATQAAPQQNPQQVAPLQPPNFAAPRR
jgi:hypothetical protein